MKEIKTHHWQVDENQKDAEQSSRKEWEPGEVIEVLREDIAIPEAVKQKANAAFSKIQQETEANEAFSKIEQDADANEIFSKLQQGTDENTHLRDSSLSGSVASNGSDEQTQKRIRRSGTKKEAPADMH
ncbi:MAG: hypothetical protein LIP11_19355 [Clostridiales bacterium]|nr:hypothetical protein [Clostridiales bacterium]